MTFRSATTSTVTPYLENGKYVYEIVKPPGLQLGDFVMVFTMLDIVGYIVPQTNQEGGPRLLVPPSTVEGTWVKPFFTGLASGIGGNSTAEFSYWVKHLEDTDGSVWKWTGNQLMGSAYVVVAAWYDCGQ